MGVDDPPPPANQMVRTTLRIHKIQLAYDRTGKSYPRRPNAIDIGHWVDPNAHAVAVLTRLYGRSTMGSELPVSLLCLRVT